MKPLQIEIYSDIACPWCFIGTRRLQAVVDALPGDIDVAIRHRAYLLHPGAPAGGIELHAMLAGKYGPDLGPVFSRVEEAARATGIPLELSKQRFTYDTTGAHTLLRHAELFGTQSALSDALFVAYFLEARNVADPAVLGDIASRFGFNSAEVERLVSDPSEIALTRLEARDASRMGIHGVPHFVFDGRYSLSGAQSPDVFRQTLLRALDRDEAGATGVGGRG